MKTNYRKRVARAACLAGILLAGNVSWAQDTPPWPEVAALDDDALDQLRGGFDWGEGLKISFGWVRTVAINGETVHQARFAMPDMSRMRAEQAALWTEAATVLPATVVQNSLSNQQISTLTEINATVNSLGLMKSLNASGVLRESLLDSVVSR
jgi:hypothetical protein